MVKSKPKSQRQVLTFPKHDPLKLLSPRPLVPEDEEDADVKKDSDFIDCVKVGSDCGSDDGDEDSVDERVGFENSVNGVDDDVDVHDDEDSLTEDLDAIDGVVEDDDVMIVRSVGELNEVEDMRLIDVDDVDSDGVNIDAARWQLPGPGSRILTVCVYKFRVRSLRQKLVG
ncbi:hypothetical protein HDU76_011872 [Blyttiomyces sp. JEL0837]|nr:hypothetical protein HDU76_011872 [Blyttiomyces sp. JEL0837]